MSFTNVRERRQREAHSGLRMLRFANIGSLPGLHPPPPAGVALFFGVPLIVNQAGQERSFFGQLQRAEKEQGRTREMGGASTVRGFQNF